MTLDICFINPPNSPFTSTGILIEPIDTLGLATWTQSLGYPCSILDMDVKQLLAQDLETIFKHKWPEVIVIVFDYHIPLHDIGANSQINEICKLAKQHGSRTILGGKAATFVEPDKLVQKIDADIYISYEMEYALQEIFEKLSLPDFIPSMLSSVKGIVYQENNMPFKTSKREDKVDIKSLPISDRNLINLKDYIDVRTLLSSRGCNLRCTFCHVPGFWGWWRGRTVESVVEEMAILRHEHNASKILFLDDNAFVQPKRLEKIAQGLIERDINVAWGCLGTIDKYNPEALETMYKGGFRWIHYGAESGDDNQLQSMGKRINTQKTREAVSGTQALGIRVRTSWIMDMPELTEDGLKRTEELILSQGSEEIRLHFLTLRLGSILHTETIHEETPQFIHNSKQNLNISGVSSDKIEQSVERILKELISQGYKVVKNAEDFKNVKALRESNDRLKIVSLCPLRYGLNWTPYHD